MIPIVFSTDHKYVMPTGVTICSLLMSAEGTNYDIYLMIGEDVTDYDRQKLTDQVKNLSPDSRITFIEMGKYYKDAYEIRGVSKATYYRLMIPWLIPDVDKIIYADVDMIFKTSLREIYEIDLTGKYLAAAITRPKEVWEKYKRYFDKIGADYSRYFNAGILVINSKLQRGDHLDREYSRLTEKKFLYQDQDILNIVCRDKTAFFDKRYNLLPSLYDTAPAYSGNVVIHYAGEKPWVTFTCAWAEWWEAYNGSLFREEGFYAEISKKILNPGHQAKVFGKKVKTRLQILQKKFL